MWTVSVFVFVEMLKRTDSLHAHAHCIHVFKCSVRDAFRIYLFTANICENSITNWMWHHSDAPRVLCWFGRHGTGKLYVRACVRLNGLCKHTLTKKYDLYFSLNRTWNKGKRGIATRHVARNFYSLKID